jgi:hypothetical protein
MLRVASLCVALAVVLSACGSSEGDRAASGAGIGAAGGAVVGAVTGLSIVEGALIGAAVGGATGYLTDEETIDLGDPVWEDDDSAGGQSGTVTRVQRRGHPGLSARPRPADRRPADRAARRSHRATDLANRPLAPGRARGHAAGSLGA